MKEVQVGKTKILVVPAGVNRVSVTHEWGDVVVSNATVVAAAQYSLTSNSIGVHKVSWNFYDSGNNTTTLVSNEFYSFYVPVISSSEFFELNEELEDFDDDFPKLEAMVRTTIQNYTGQKFGPYVSKTLEIQGDGGDSLELPVQVLALTSIDSNYGDSLLDLVEVSPNDRTFLQRHSRFRGASYYDIKRDIGYQHGNIFNSNNIFTIVGTFGWEYVPTEVSQAANILIADLIGSDDIAEMRQKGVFETHLGDFSLRLNADQWGTTGNTYADNLLSTYVKMGIGLV